MNESQCSSLIESVKWTEPANLISLAILAFINVLVIVGNCLVIAAVFCSHKLRSVTNFFIVSLAVADLLVGLAVLPFSATWEVFKVWIFGDVWCRIWLAVDVWMCTASILNLCAISLDRYVAVTRPVTYPSIMSTKRAKSLIAGIWVLSFVICFPPLVGWKDQKTDTEHRYRNGNITLISATAPPPPPPPCPWTCELTNDAGYVVYSALGSFYIPMFVMLFFYWRIYKAAVRTTRAINQGFRTTKGSRASKGSRGKGTPAEQEQKLTLRIHRGHGGRDRPFVKQESLQSMDGGGYSGYSGGNNKTSPTSEKSISSQMKKHEKILISVSYQSSDVTASAPPTPLPSTINTALCSSNANEKSIAKLTRRQSFQEKEVRHFTFDEGMVAQSRNNTRDLSPKTTRKMGRRNIKLQVKRFRMETKAAKTLAIIVGGFIFCWFPFFSIYLFRAFCATCINPILFSVLFWLGYCNSAVNPVVYALFSKEFRLAFMRIICKCFCSTSPMDETQAKLNRQVISGSSGSQGRKQPLASPCMTPVASPFINHSTEDIRMR